MNVTIETKVCKKCGEDKPLTDFHKKSAASDGLDPHCKVCRKAKDKAYYEANSERVKAATRAYREANRDEILASMRAYREANREELRAYFRAYKADRYANDPEFRSMYNAYNTRRSRLLAEAVQEPYLREDIFERDNWTCQLCQEPIDSELKWPERGSASIDHVVPVSHGGDDTPANVQAAHFGCNSAKGNRVELEDLQAA